jgi:DUF1009 family protein
VTGLGVIAGGGDLPIAIAECATEAGRPVFIAALRGIADERVAQFPHEWVSLGQTGRTLSLLRQHDCSDVLLAGQVTRPNWSDIRFDTTAMRKLPKVMAAALQGDDALLRSLVAILEGEGFHVVGAAEAAPELVAKEGVFGKHHPSAQHETDIDLGIRVVEALGTFDIGQAAVVCDSLVLAVEAAEGTDHMIARAGTLSENVRGTLQKPRGVLIKARKPTQDGKTDLPVIGVQTVKNAAAVGLAGIAVEAGSALIVNRKAVVQSADEARLFLLGFRSSRQPT